MAHQIKHFFQYQEEKQRSESWDGAVDFPGKKQTLMTTPPSGLSRPHDNMNPAELSYYEHKSKLRKTQVSHHGAGEEREAEESSEECEEAKEKMAATRGSTLKYTRVPLDRPGGLSGGASSPGISGCHVGFGL